MANFRELGQLYNTYSLFELRGMAAQVYLASRVSKRLAQSVLQANLRLLFSDIDNLPGHATILPEAAKVKRRFGGV